MSNTLKIEYEYILPRRAMKQPKPNVNPEGDCGPCVLAGVVGLPGVMEVYNRYNKGKIEAFSHVAFKDLIHQAESEGLISHYIYDVPHWHVWQGHQVFGSPAWCQNLQWFNYICMAIQAGYYGMASISMDGKGAYVDPDHFVLICGAREVSIPHETMEGCFNLRPEILVSCPARHVEGVWFPVLDFLKNQGGFNAYLVKPTKQ
jgi:hypothetical protein